MSRLPIRTELIRGPDPGDAWRRLHAAVDGPFALNPAWAAAVGAHLPRRECVWCLAARDDALLGGFAWIETSFGPWRRLEAHHAGMPGAPLLDPALPPGDRDAVRDALLDAWLAASTRRSTLAAAMHLTPEWDAVFGPRLASAGFARDEVPAAFFPLDGGLAHVETHLLRKNRRNERNRSLRRGCTTAVSDDPTVIDEFYPIYLAACSRWGSPPTPRGLLADLLRRGGGRAFCTTVRCEGELLGAHVCLAGAGTVTAWIGATRDDREDVFPATLLVWTDLEEACRRGARVLDLGGHGGQRGVENFKRLLGAETAARSTWHRESTLYAAARRLRGRRSG